MYSETAGNELTDLREDDVRVILRLAGEALTMPHDHSARKSRLMTGLCKLTGATAWAWALGRQVEPGKPPVYAAFEQGGFGQEQFTRYLTALEHPEIKRLNAFITREMAEQKIHITRSSDQIRPSSQEAGELWRQAGLGPAIVSLRPLGKDAVSGIALYRRIHEEPFSPRHTHIVHLVLSELSWLHETGWPEESAAEIPKLFPRERVIFNLLLQGFGRKSISEHLGISINTVAGYVKSIYKRLGVQSHAGLMWRFRTTPMNVYSIESLGDQIPVRK
jgi:DNA-binding CsgD family transcriptional regulator